MELLSPRVSACFFALHSHNSKIYEQLLNEYSDSPMWFLQAIWFVLGCITGLHTEPFGPVEFGIEFAVWWLGLGILSSIGLGSGLQSGVLFLFPHIIKVALAAQTCKTLDFESYSDMWFRSPPNLFKCPPLTVDSTPVTLWGTWRKILLVCFLQSAGTAIGEIPPYWMTKAARLAAIEAGTYQQYVILYALTLPHLSILRLFRSTLLLSRHQQQRRHARRAVYHLAVQLYQPRQDLHGLVPPHARLLRCPNHGLLSQHRV